MAKNQSYSFDKIEDTLSSNEFVNQGRGSESRGSKSSGPVEIGVAGLVLFVLLTLALCFATGFVVYFLRPDARCNVTSSESSGSDRNSSTSPLSTRKCFSMSLILTGFENTALFFFRFKICS